MYGFQMPAGLVAMNAPGWTFGDVFFTDEAMDIIDRGADIDAIFRRIVSGDYGVISTDEQDHAMTQKAREAGRRFVAVYEEPEGTLYVAVNERGRTIVCHSSTSTDEKPMMAHEETEKIMRPLRHLHAISRRYPDAWKQIEIFREDKDSWPEWCYIPMGGPYAIVSTQAGMEKLWRPDLLQDMTILSALAPWRYTQSIYRFDPDLFAAVAETKLSGDLPCEVLLRLPEWSIYVETDGLMGGELHGFWVHLEYDIDNGSYELRLLLDITEGLYAFPILLGDWTLAEAIEKLNKKGDTINVPVMARILMPLLSLVLYICSDGAEIAGPEGRKPGRPVPVRTKKGMRLFPADKPTVWRVGEHVGEELRVAKTSYSGTGGTKSPHLRRAHWHGYWYGAEKRQYKYHWLSQVMVKPKKTALAA